MWGALLGGALAGLGSIGAGAMASSAQDNANEMNREQAEKNREFQAYMSNTAYQRAATDMKYAGINPIMAYSQGGASSPSGSTAQMIAADGMAEGIKGAAGSAMQAAALNKEMEQKDATIELNKAQADVAKTQVDLNESSALSIQKDINRKTVENRMLDETEKTYGKGQRNERHQLDIDYKMQDYDNTMKRLNDALGAANSAASVLKPKVQIGGGGPEPRDSSGRTRTQVERDSYKRQLETYQRSKR